MANLPFVQRRRSSRLRFQCRVKVSGTDRDGHEFTEETETVCVSKFGASLKTTHLYALGQTVTVQTVEQGHSELFQVVWLKSPTANRPGQIGIERVDSQRFWGIEFPPDDWNGN